jgi:cell division septum initiation protein DivIVA
LIFGTGVIKEQQRALNEAYTYIEALEAQIRAMQDYIGQLQARIRSLEQQVAYWKSQAYYWRGQAIYWKGQAMYWKGQAMYWKGQAMYWKGEAIYWHGRADFWRGEFYDEQDRANSWQNTAEGLSDRNSELQDAVNQMAGELEAIQQAQQEQEDDCSGISLCQLTDNPLSTITAVVGIVGTGAACVYTLAIGCADAAMVSYSAWKGVNEFENGLQDGESIPGAAVGGICTGVATRASYADNNGESTVANLVTEAC